jgi:predicted permease
MVQQMRCGDAELAGDIVVMTSAVSILSFFLWILVFKNIGAF